jgi:hypothetical protein
MGMMNNNWFRVKVHQLGNGEIWFEHPTQVDNRHSIDKNAPLQPQGGEQLHVLENGNLASLGWMDRMKEDVVAVYAPGKPEDLDVNEGWEREKQHLIGKKEPEVAKVVERPKEHCLVAAMQMLTDFARDFEFKSMVLL